MSETRNALASRPQGVRNALAKPLSLGLWQRLMEIFGGAQGDGTPPEYMPIDALPPDAQDVQRRKARALRDAMRAE